MAELRWDIEIEKLDAFFKTIQYPKSIIVHTYMKIEDMDKFLDSHFQMVRKNNGKFTFLPYLHRLRSLKIFFEGDKESYPLLDQHMYNNRIAS